jgi:hypothetical protein
MGIFAARITRATARRRPGCKTAVASGAVGYNALAQGAGNLSRLGVIAGTARNH